MSASLAQRSRARMQSRTKKQNPEQLALFAKRLSNLNSIYNYSSPAIFKELLATLINEPLNTKTQLKIEKFLQSQALALNQANLDSDKSKLGYGKISNEITLLFLKSKESLIKLISNYKTNLILGKPELTSLFSRIIFNLDVDFIISIFYGRILVIIANREQLNKRNTMLDVAIGLGKEIIKAYLLHLYKTASSQYEGRNYSAKWT
jgi:hypothetical protein